MSQHGSVYSGRGSNMTASWLDARFQRAVEIVQTLPKAGTAIQTSYEDKLLLYSLYKQATEGPPTQSRPGILDMLGRAKYDAWKKREFMTKSAAQEAYAVSLLKILKNFKDQPQAAALISELESYARGNPGDLSYSATTALGSSSHSSYTASDDATGYPTPKGKSAMYSPESPSGPSRRAPQYQQQQQGIEEEEYTSGSETETDDDEPPRQPPSRSTPVARPPSSVSGRTGPYPYIHPAQLPDPPLALQQRSLGSSRVAQGKRAPSSSSYRSNTLRPVTPPPQQDPHKITDALDTIQTSLTALHERLASLETITKDEQSKLVRSGYEPIFELFQRTLAWLAIVLRIREPSRQPVRTRRPSYPALLLSALTSLFGAVRNGVINASALFVLLVLLASLRRRNRLQMTAILRLAMGLVMTGMGAAGVTLWPGFLFAMSWFVL